MSVYTTHTAGLIPLDTNVVSQCVYITIENDELECREVSSFVIVLVTHATRWIEQHLDGCSLWARIYMVLISKLDDLFYVHTVHTHHLSDDLLYFKTTLITRSISWCTLVRTRLHIYVPSCLTTSIRGKKYVLLLTKTCCYIYIWHGRRR